jgi:hypothetical protein
LRNKKRFFPIFPDREKFKFKFKFKLELELEDREKRGQVDM